MRLNSSRRRGSSESVFHVLCHPCGISESPSSHTQYCCRTANRARRDPSLRRSKTALLGRHANRLGWQLRVSWIRCRIPRGMTRPGFDVTACRNAVDSSIGRVNLPFGCQHRAAYTLMAGRSAILVDGNTSRRSRAAFARRSLQLAISRKIPLPIDLGVLAIRPLAHCLLSILVFPSGTRRWERITSLMDHIVKESAKH